VSFWNFCQYYVGGIWTKHKKEQMWKHVMNLVTNKMKTCFKPKTRMKVIIELNILELCRIVFLSSRLWFFMKRFCHEFLMFEHALFSCIMVCIHLKCYPTSDVHFTTCALCLKKMIKKIMDPKSKDVLFFSIFLHFWFWLNNFFYICFDNLIKFYASYHYSYNTSHVILT